MTTSLRVGRVLRASTRSFVVGCRVMRENIPAFGALVSATSPTDNGIIYGLIYDVGIKDDVFVRQLVTADLPEEVVRDQRENHWAPIEVSVLAVGCYEDGGIRHCLLRQPPVTLDWLHHCEPHAVITFTQRFDYFRLVLEAPGVPTGDLLSANSRYSFPSRLILERMCFSASTAAISDFRY